MRRGLVVGLLAGLLWCGEARAGTYDVYGCRLPDGTAIPARGWTSMVPTLNGWVDDGCRRGGSLTAALDPAATLPPLTRAGWEFDAPPDTEIGGYTIFRSAVVDGSWSASRAAVIYHDAPFWDGGARQYTQELCMVMSMNCYAWGSGSSPLAPINRYERSALRIRRVILASECMVLAEYDPSTGTTTVPPCPPLSTDSQPRISIHASRITLADSLAPTFAATPGGALLDSSAQIQGRLAATFDAEDRGGGVSSVSVVVDGVLVGEQPADPNAADCRTPYTTPVPCPLRTKGNVEFDTTSIANGAHQVSLAVSDAAGNRTTSTPVTVTVRNPGAPNGAHASRFARLDAWFETRSSRHRNAATLPYARTRAIVGTLVDESGAPIRDAVLDLTATAARPEATIRSLGQVATDSAGRFRYLPRAGSSRKVMVSYRAFHLDAAPSATSALNLSVRAGVTLSVRPSRVSAHGRIHFDGRLRGGPGRAGTQVAIYALGGARRIPVATVRADAKGRFHYGYRFRNSAPGVTYRFQATMHSQRSYPYATGSSRLVMVQIR